MAFIADSAGRLLHANLPTADVLVCKGRAGAAGLDPHHQEDPSRARKSSLKGHGAGALGAAAGGLSREEDSAFDPLERPLRFEVSISRHRYDAVHLPSNSGGSDSSSSSGSSSSSSGNSGGSSSSSSSSEAGTSGGGGTAARGGVQVVAASPPQL